MFQRTDCPNSFVGVTTNVNGQYGVALGKGRYKVIMREGTREGKTWDVLAPSQPQFVEVTGPGKDTEFNIEVLFPKR